MSRGAAGTAFCVTLLASPYTTWSDYGGSADSMQYSALKQINKKNVNQLELVWFHPVPGPSGRFGFNPVIVEGTMYVLGKGNAIVALNAATGKFLNGCQRHHPTAAYPVEIDSAGDCGSELGANRELES